MVRSEPGGRDISRPYIVSGGISGERRRAAIYGGRNFRRGVSTGMRSRVQMQDEKRRSKAPLGGSCRRSRLRGDIFTDAASPLRQKGSEGPFCHLPRGGRLGCAACGRDGGRENRYIPFRHSRTRPENFSFAAAAASSTSCSLRGWSRIPAAILDSREKPSTSIPA